ncbi:hypothetical protein CKN86_05855 [Carnobacterium divergens]|uniref:hypothetical protein n=1 Tax=Carnobacterium divergens TaxID=2748 RepID=UPI000D6E80A4|nr:hypothetical protein [Carnobacterium divergens]MCO6017108.1 hypothetical protein [Carnobacterium divergens]TFI62362.1 hypothetical protein CKN62_05890 [Carnobacterium divergens]TFI89564.1 hypothetical protein CKN84_05890 [Carnobacterium divergens]TFJ04619.1 hypothetical protein CKN86_05855 [Carnobacterium divergens]TFJ06109.1 hypothetical protein CKN65_05895 [Carnobacterium divergens]
MKASFLFYYQLLKQKWLTILLVQISLNLVSFSLLLSKNGNRGLEHGLVLPILFTLGSLLSCVVQVMKLDTNAKTKTLVSFTPLSEFRKTITKFLIIYMWIVLFVCIQFLFSLIFQTLLTANFDWQSLLYLPQLLLFLCLFATMFSCYILLPFYWLSPLIHSKPFAFLSSLIFALTFFLTFLFVQSHYVPFSFSHTLTILPNVPFSISLESLIWNLFFIVCILFIDTKLKAYFAIKNR